MKHDKIVLTKRNPFVLLALKRKAGSHTKPHKSVRGKQHWDV
jgi:hypothetical protein